MCWRGWEGERQYDTENVEILDGDKDLHKKNVVCMFFLFSLIFLSVRFLSFYF